ncbi:glycosyltransferase family 2 protein [Paenirhodobacter enshiensis]|uniref:glycosyltransferase family 2 protein n=1 Tax=Paenirhodobacter enshiensis TaxID=1105367 RepID=UPI00068EA287|nr:glycosyltransferase family 2 protein [Paenirhodobacter enshiensis]
MGAFHDLRLAIGARAKRQRLLLRAYRSRHDLAAVRDRTAAIRPDTLLLFATMRNESVRLPYFLRHYRKMGIGHFLIVDNDSTDGTAAMLAAEPDVSLWRSGASYRASRFGMDWINHLLRRYGSGHWCLTVDADELLTIPHRDTRDLRDLTGWLDARGVPMMAALMLDLYPRGALSGAVCPPGTDPATVLNWFDADNYTWEFQPRFRNISIRGGVRRRVFFADTPENAPHLHKVPLIRWNRRYAYVSSTHVALPRRLNAGFDARLSLPTGVLLHDKFLDQIIAKSRDEKLRGEHFTHAARYDGYYDALIADPVLWNADSQQMTDWRGLETLGLMSRGAWC